ncbi:formate dehydrogenase accessory sulfurtransferase FdhD [Salininema proteolyticum]|uniref:Sulfur carrier protein FdhD n=1 Tax=Salininema proteolyticum TaxID=1607685 RepID=A0ABV8U3Q7_9ACTN
MGRRTVKRRTRMVRAEGTVRRGDEILVEEPLEIRVDGAPYSTTMRTPGGDFDLAAGFLHSEGVIAEADDLVSVKYCRLNGTEMYNIVEVRTAARVEAPCGRSHLVNSSCGVCGKRTVEEIAGRAVRVPEDGRTVDGSVVAGLAEDMKPGQELFAKTGGAHAAALVDFRGEVLAVREDIGRHNAVDKVVGWALREGALPLSETVLAVTSRASFEIVQKAAFAGVPVVSAVSAPSSMAVSLAEEAGMTLVAFNRGERYNVYTRPERIGGVA